MDAISTLQRIRVAVVLVSNRELHGDDVSDLRSLCVAVIERTNIGRDFGAYQTGYNYVRETFSSRLNDPDSPKKIIFMNDTVVYFSTRFGQMVTSILEKDCDFFGATGSYESGLHISSYFFGFSSRSFIDASVQDFWRRYRPISSRHHAIRQGEIGLSQMMIKRGYTPFLSFSHLEIAKLLMTDNIDNDIFAFISLPTRRDLSNHYKDNSLGFLSSGKTVSNGMQTILPLDYGSRSAMDLTTLNYCLSTRSHIHHFNLLLLIYMEFPFLKRDLVKKDIYEPSLVEYVLEGLVTRDADFEKYRSQVLEVIGSRDTVRWAPVLRRYLLRVGIS